MKRQTTAATLRERPVGIVRTVALALVFVTGVVNTSGVVAAPTNCGSQSTLFDGAIVTPTSSYMNLAEADVDREDPDLCTSVGTNANTVTWWVMIADSDLEGWAQVGYLKNAPVGEVQYFYQWVRNSGTALHTDVFSSPSTGSHSLKVAGTASSSCPTSSHCLVMKIDDAAMGLEPYTGFDPHVAWSGSLAEFFGEAKFPGADMPGVSENKARFRNIQEKDGQDIVSASWAGASGSDCPYWKFQNPNGAGVYTAFNIWTDPTGHSSAC
jgi:hypothetical protein